MAAVGAVAKFVFDVRYIFSSSMLLAARICRLVLLLAQQHIQVFEHHTCEPAMSNKREMRAQSLE